jgi:hypothetical protein
MSASKKPGYYWASRGEGEAPVVVEIYDVSGELWVKFMGSHYILDLAQADEEFEFLERIPEPGSSKSDSESAKLSPLDRCGRA